ncbi:MAG: M81 family metallopeptidase [Rhodospirillales bacterium]|nr:M81 family metallopeptidase [Rhodospirillales bacterium]
MATIAIGGFQHETNTFAPTKASYADFESGGGWPALARGAAVPEQVAGVNLSIAGFIEAARAAGHRLVPLVWANATPSAHVTRDAFERITGMMIEELGRAGAVDAVYLDLHGAMVAEHVDDGEGEILARVRKIIGPRVPIVATLDLHANVSKAMIERTEALVAYRTYPHVDMTETGQRAFRMLATILERGEAPAKAFRQLPFLIPITAQCTLIDPGQKLYARLAELEASSGATLSFTPGFPAADFADCGPAVFGYAANGKGVEATVAMLAGEAADAEGEFLAEFLSPDDAVRRAMTRTMPGGPPVVLADTQDNPGAGGNGDTVGLLAAMLRQRAEDAVLGLLIDPAAAKQAHAAGVEAETEFALGAASGWAGEKPIAGRFTVERLGDGAFTCTGPFYRGSQMRLGPMALLRRGGVRVVVASKKVQAADQEMFRHLGVEPARMRIVALKSSVHFRAHFQPIAREVLVVASPGPNPADPADLDWRKLRPGVRLRPHGPVFSPKAGR